MKQLVGIISVSIYILIRSNCYNVNLHKDITAAALGAGLPKSSLTSLFETISNGTEAALDAVSGMTAAIEKAVAQGTKTAWTSTLSTVYYSSLAFAGLDTIALFSSDIDSHINGLRIASDRWHRGHECPFRVDNQTRPPDGR